MITVTNLFMKEINSLISVTIPKGVTLIEGKNGSGKTIFLDYLCNIRHDKEESIIGNDNTIYMRQNFSFHNRIKVDEFINFIYQLCEVDYNFPKFLGKYDVPFDFEKLKNTKLGLLSGGERRSLYILVILSIDRTWYVFDEPFVNIDKEMKRVIINIIHKLQEQGKNFVITNHEDNIAFKHIAFNKLDFEAQKIANFHSHKES